MLPTAYFLALGALLFFMGLVGAGLRRDLPGLVGAAVLMLLGNVLSLMAFDRSTGQADGRVLALFLIAVVLGQLALGLALSSNFYRRSEEVDLGRSGRLKW